MSKKQRRWSLVSHYRGEEGIKNTLFPHRTGGLTCFWPGGGEGGQGQQKEATQSSQLSHLHPDDSDLADGELLLDWLAGSNCGGGGNLRLLQDYNLCILTC